MDPIATIATPQELVLWSRLGPYDRAELDRVLWKDKKLIEWQAFIYPVEDLPLLRALMREPWGPLKRHQWPKQFMQEQSATAQLHPAGARPARAAPSRASSSTTPTRCRPPHDLVGDARAADVDARAAGTAGKIAVAGRDRGQRLWDLAKRWWPAT